MSDLLIVLVTFGFLFCLFGMYYSYKMKKMKTMAALRKMEMDKGYEPGTYSYIDKKDKKKRKGKEDRSFSQQNERIKREAIIKGIEDLEKRIDNIDTILKEKEERK